MVEDRVGAGTEHLEASLKDFYLQLSQLAEGGDPEPTPTPNPTPIPTPPPKDEGLDKQLADKQVTDKSMQDMSLTIAAQISAQHASFETLIRQMSSHSAFLQRALGVGGVSHFISRGSRPDVALASLKSEPDLHHDQLKDLQARFAQLMTEIVEAVRHGTHEHA